MAADIYTYHNEDGQLYFTDKRMGNSYKLISIYRPQLTRQSTADYSLKKYKNNQKKFLPHIRHAAIQHRLDYKLLQAIIDTESAFNPQAYSKAGAIGLMQLMPQTAKQPQVQNSWNPIQNIQ
ncbi:MAG: transglycosylase SLT domain-containing protein, partial [Ghiorsea sp.]|nr:transglycosylase SLT domain-containing protein [Ghiorsea sp.]